MLAMTDERRALPARGDARAGDAGGEAGGHSFKNFLRAHRLKIFIILMCAAGVRAGFVLALNDPVPETRYHPTAVNLLEGHGFSIDTQAPYGPSEAAAPAYPVFLAAMYALFGRHVSVPAWSQAFLDLLTCLLVAFVSFNLAPAPLKRRAALVALAVYGLFSWPTITWIPSYLAEILTFFFMMLAVSFAAAALRGGSRYWFGAGLACGLAILTRPDSVLTLAAFLLFLSIRWVRRPSRAGAAACVLFCAAVALALAPWVARNYVAFGKFQPLASEYGYPTERYFPTGNLWWVRTWLKDETYFEYAFAPTWSPGSYVDPGQLPPGSYDSEAERQRLAGLLARYNEDGFITPEADREFREIGNERIRRAPLRFFVLLPLYRTASMWLTGFSTSHKKPYVLALRVASVLPIHVGGLIGFVLFCRRRPLAALLALIMLVRTAFMAYHYAPETRYMAEVYPLMIAACGVAYAALWGAASRWKAKFF